MLHIPVTHRGSPDDQRAITHRIRDGIKVFRTLQQLRSSHRALRLQKRRLKRTHHSQPPKSKIAHRPRRRPNIQRIPRGYQHYAQPVELCRSKQVVYSNPRLKFLSASRVIQFKEHIKMKTVPVSKLRLISSLMLILAFAVVPAFVSAADAPAIIGNWEGSMSAGGQSFRIQLHFTQSKDGAITGTLVSPD
jgi:hypothetical protein